MSTHDVDASRILGEADSGSSRRWRNIGRKWVLGTCVLLTLAAACGKLVDVLFAQPSRTKWEVSVFACAALLALLLSRRPVSYLAAGAIIAVPFFGLSINRGSHDIPIGAIVCAVAVVVASASSNRSPNDPLMPQGRISRPWIPIAGGAAAVSLIPATILGGHPAVVAVQLAYLCAFVFVIARACALDRHAPALLTLAVVIAAAIQGVMAIVEFKSGRSFSAYGGGVSTFGANYFFGYEGEFRPTGAFSDPISLANMLAITLPLSISAAASRRNHPYVRLLAAVGGIVAAAALVVTLSRMSWVGAAVGVTVAIVLSPVATWRRQITGLFITAVALSSTVIALAGSTLTQRFQSLFDPTGEGVVTASSDRAREQLWAAALHEFSNHPLAGVGLGNLVNYLPGQVAGSSLSTHAHSTYFQMLAEAGLVGGAVILMVIGSAARDVYFHIKQFGRDDWLASGCAGSIAAMLVCWSTDYTVRYTPVLLWMAIPFVLIAVTRRMRNSTMDTKVNVIDIDDPRGERSEPRPLASIGRWA